ncbi:MAG: hypothetical protein IKO72_06120 [Kiritimatiellae bacterium]|nr:hypothetical protein [Kiritimatiellia bacterium]
MSKGRILAAGFAVFALAVQAFEVRQVFREERFTRGNVNLRQLQPADDADWIWIEGAGPAKGEMDAVRFSRSFVAQAEPLVLDVSGDERFVLFLDGREIARGPHKGDVHHWYYQTYEIASLTPGRHRLDAIVYRMEGRRPTGVLTYGRGGFLLKAGGAYDRLLTTGRVQWDAVRIAGTRMCGYGDSESFGGSGECVVEGTGFLDPAAVTGVPCTTKVVRAKVRDHEGGVSRPGWALFPTERPDQMAVTRHPGKFKAGQPLYRADTNIYYVAADAAFPLVADMNALLNGKPVTIPAGTSARLVWDLGDYYCAYPVLEAAGGKGAEVRWGWAESLYDRSHQRADRDAFDQKRCAHALRDTFRTDGRAAAHFTSPWWRCGRWCEFEVKTAEEPLTLTRLAFTEVRYPLAVKASFDCDDASIADVWRICLRGLENCMHETYMDCPYFEQQMYPGDTRVVMLIVDALSGDSRLTRFGAGLFDYARRDNGLVPMNYPCRTVQDSSTYSLCWAMMLGDYALWQGRDGWLKARLPGMRHTLHLILNYVNDEGLLVDLPGWSFQDWVLGWSWHGTAPDGVHGLSSVNNLLAVYALDCAAHAEDAAGDPLMAAYWRTKKKALADATLRKFWCERRGLVADTVRQDCFSEHAQCLALLSDILPPERERRVLDGLLSDADLARTTVYFSHYLFDVYVKYGRTDLFLKRLDLWRGYVKDGLRTPLEAPGLRARSDCHAWGSHPIYHLLTGVAGIRPAADGFSAVSIAPQPGGLKWFKAAMPTPRGQVSLDLRFDGGRVAGTVSLPAGLPGRFAWKGAVQSLQAGVNKVEY